jgi:outer membrane protein OmpA-like peptidoglycan-associated protein
MAELDVQPKKKSPILWIMLLIVILALSFFLLRGCNGNSVKPGANSDSTDVVATTVTSWDSVNFDAPPAEYEEVTDKSIEVRGNDRYTIYGLGENVLFATDKSDIQSSAESQLKQIASSLKRRYSGARIAIFGSTDSTGTASHNIELGAARANTVKNWLVANAGVQSDNITIHTKGESDATASNATQSGRKLNRSVQIVAMADTK